MVSKQSRTAVREKKHARLRNRFSGTTERPRLAVFRSNNHMYAQIIDDTVGNTLAGEDRRRKCCSICRYCNCQESIRKRNHRSCI